MSEILYQVVSGLKFPKLLDQKSIEFALKYRPKSGDKFIITYPKCGTTWVQQIINLILTDAEPDPNNKTFMRKSYLEWSGKDMDGLQSIKTHIPFDGLTLNAGAKYMLVFRNPKDCCVSYYYLALKVYPEFNGNFHDFFERWIRGDVPYGDYFEHVLNYWNHRFDVDFQFLVYEQMKVNPRDAVLKIAHFLGPDYRPKLEENESLIQEIIKKSSIDSMRNDLDVFKHYIRKGVVGDWRNHFTKEESDLVDHKVETTFGGTGLEKLWANHLKWEIQ